MSRLTASHRVTPVNRTGSDPAFFSCWDIHSYYGESYIVQGVSFDVREGEVLALLGRNGAGKTSTLRSIARVDSPQIIHGELWLDHQPLHSMKSHEAAQSGVALVPEDRRIIGGMTVEEVAHVLGLSKTTVESEWRMARAWLRHKLTAGESSR